ncbi:hypothetical protein P20495_3216 [Pseudoalteromonas sp. BSi20495]|nr:hypothetical protein P20495_3216 [Pseudoalteromonas sp. BSi20495]
MVVVDNYQEAEKGISNYLMKYYNWHRPRNHNQMVSAVVAEEKFNSLS